jgi:hypothetical protein
MEFLQSLQQSALARFIGESGSVWGYPTILFLHTLGLGTVAGLSAAVNLRLLGFAARIPLAPLDRLFPLMWVGFVVSALSGLALLIADPVARLTQTVFYVKLLFVAIAVVNMQLVRSRVFRNPALEGKALPANARMLAVSSIFFWMGATTAGRLIAYL